MSYCACVVACKRHAIGGGQVFASLELYLLPFSAAKFVVNTLLFTLWVRSCFVFFRFGNASQCRTSLRLLIRFGWQMLPWCVWRSLDIDLRSLATRIKSSRGARKCKLFCFCPFWWFSNEMFHFAARRTSMRYCKRIRSSQMSLKAKLLRRKTWSRAFRLMIMTRSASRYAYSSQWLFNLVKEWPVN